MQSLASFWSTVEDFLDQFGIGIYGKGAQMRRFLVFTSGWSLLMWEFKPIGLFTEEGNARAWDLTGADPQGTYVPWWMLSAFIGLLSVLIV